MRQRKAVAAELLVVGLLLGYGWFSVFRLIVVLLLVVYSLWIRGLSWAEIGLSRPRRFSRVILQGSAAAVAILIAVRFVIVPAAVAITGTRVDLSAIEAMRGNPVALGILLAQAWTLTAFGEEIVFRGYLIRRIGDLAGSSAVAVTAAVIVSSIFFGWAHRYQGPAGMVATGAIGALVAVLFVMTRSLWPAIICHGVVDTIALIVIYFGHRSWLFR